MSQITKAVETITELFEWGEIAAILAIAVAVGAILTKLWTWLNGIFSRIARRNNRPIMEISLEVDEDDHVEFIVQTFRLNPKRNANDYEEYWEEDKRIPFSPIQGRYKVEKKKILANLAKASYPYKFFLRMEPASSAKYYARLADAGLIVTGRGDPDSQKNDLWRIWFLVSDEPQHPKITDLWRVNHKL